MPQPLMPKKLKLNGSMMTCNTSRTNTKKKDVLFIIGVWNAKVVSQEIPGVTGKFVLGVQNEARQRLTEFCQENALVMANTLFQQYKRWLYTWTSPDGQHQNQIDYILCSQRWRRSIQLAKTRLGSDCGSDHELLIVKFRLKLKKVGKTTRPFRYNLNYWDIIRNLMGRTSRKAIVFWFKKKKRTCLLPFSLKNSSCLLHKCDA